MYCENCGASLKETAKFCDQCGASVKAGEEVKKYCKNCLAQALSGWRQRAAGWILQRHFYLLEQ